MCLKGHRHSWRAAPITLTPSFLWPAALCPSHTASAAGGQEERAVQGGLSPTQPTLAVVSPKQAACLLPSPHMSLLPQGLGSEEAPPAFSSPACPLGLPQVSVAGFVLFFCGVSGPDNSMGLVNLWAPPSFHPRHLCSALPSPGPYLLLVVWHGAAASEEGGSRSHP